MLKKGRGFSLIELLIVIAIIGVLSTIVTVSFNAAQKRSRDSKRKTDLSLIMGALVNYANDNGGEFLSSDGSIKVRDINTSPENIVEKLVDDGGYLTSVPCDPLGCRASNGTEVGDLDYSGYVYYRGGEAMGSCSADSTKKKTGFLYANLESPKADDSATLASTGFDKCLTQSSAKALIFPGDLTTGRKINYKLSN